MCREQRRKQRFFTSNLLREESKGDYAALSTFLFSFPITLLVLPEKIPSKEHQLENPSPQLRVACEQADGRTGRVTRGAEGGGSEMESGLLPRSWGTLSGLSCSPQN